MSSGEKNKEKVLVYVRPVCKNSDNTYEYDLYFSSTPEYVWGPEWDVASPANNGDITPDSSTYDKIMRLRTDLPLKTFEETSCYSMEYVTNDIFPLSWIDIENLEEYPEKGRMVMRFGDTETKTIERIHDYGWTIASDNAI